MQSSMADYAPPALTCLIEGESSPFIVEPKEDINMMKLKRLIKEEGINPREHTVLSKDLKLWKVDLEAPPKNELKGLTGKNVTSSAELEGDFKKFSHYWPANDRPDPEHIHIIVQLPPVPGDGSPTLINVVGDQPVVVDSSPVGEYDDFFIKVKKWGSFDQSDVGLNSLRKHDDEMRVPDFVAKVERELDAKPGLTSDANYGVKFIRNNDFLDAYFGPLETRTVEDGSPEEFISESESRRHAGELEVAHLANIAFLHWEEYWEGKLGNSLKEPSMNVIFLHNFALNTLQTSRTITVLTSNQPWPFNLVMKCYIEEKNEFRKYQPRSDLLVVKFNLPRLLVEVNLKPRSEWPEDLIRMLLMGAAVVRFANNFLDKFMVAKDFVLFAMYIWDNGRVTRYSLFQGPNKQVSYKATIYGVSTSVQRAKFVRQLYNLRHVLERDEETEDTKAKIDQLQYKIEQYDNDVHMKSFYSKTKNNTNKRRRLNDNEGAGAGGGAGGVNLAACAELTAHGYEVQPQVIVDERGCEAKLLSDVRQPLIYLCAALKLDLQMPPHILTVYQRSVPGKTFIAKKVPEESDEIKFLKHLNTRQQRSEHIISLHDSFPTQSGSWVILPKMRCVAGIVSLAPGKVAQVCWGLIKGVAYIHNLYIAHRDIKPANLVVDRDFCLKIIDFDVATQVNDEDEVVDGQCGTKGWMAPEMEKSMYSPIKADRWSTGQVILYLLDKFRKEDTVLRATARKLTAHNPEQRSSMLQVAASLSDVAKVAVERKALQSLQDAVEVDGENAELPRVKKQKFSVPEGVGLGVFYQPEPHQPVVRVQ